MTFTGSCHCGEVRYEVEGELGRVMECNCSHCSRKGYLLWFLPRAQMKFIAGGDKLATYLFNKHVIRHQFCPTCGCAPLAFGDRACAEMVAVNVRCLEGVDIATLERQPVDGRSL